MQFSSSSPGKYYHPSIPQMALDDMKNCHMCFLTPVCPTSRFILDLGRNTLDDTSFLPCFAQIDSCKSDREIPRFYPFVFRATVAYAGNCGLLRLLAF